MRADTKSLLNDYVNGISDLQRKYKKDDDKFVLLALLLVFIVEYMTSPPTDYIKEYAPFLLKIDLQDNVKVLTNIDNAIKGKGTLKDDLEWFEKRNSPILNYIIKTRKKPPKAPFIAITQKQKIKQLEEDSKLMEQSNDISLTVNTMLFNKRYKVWNTQNDKLVRKTDFHNGVANMRVGINELFRVGGYSALFPAHSTLPAFERYNCRCYLTYQ